MTDVAGIRFRLASSEDAAPIAALHAIGFAHTILDEDSTWGALLDNLGAIRRFCSDQFETH